MPATMIKNLAAKAKRSEKEVEYLWHKAKAIVKAEYDVDEDDGAFWGLTTGITKKMLGMKESLSFKQFIEESFNSKTMDLKETAKYLKKNASEYMWMLKDTKFIYRGDRNLYIMPDTAVKIDLSSTERKSANTSNHYTVIFDNHPEMDQFPKRSKSLICSIDYDKAKDYQSYGTEHPFIVIPTNGSRIGFTNHHDIWDTYIKIFNADMSIHNANDAFIKLGIGGNSIQDFYTFAEKLMDPDSKQAADLDQMLYTNGLRHTDKEYARIFNHFVEHVFDAFDPSKTGFYTASGSAAAPLIKGIQEIWVDGGAVIINLNDIHKLRKLLHEI